MHPNELKRLNAANESRRNAGHEFGPDGKVCLGCGLSHVVFLRESKPRRQCEILYEVFNLQ